AQCSYDGGPPVNCLGTATAGTFSTPAGGEGLHTFSVTVCATVTLCANQNMTFTVDRTAPVIAIDPIADPNNLSPLAVTFSVSGGATTVTCQLDTAAPVPCATSFTTPALANGPHVLQIVATDAATNAATATASWTTDTIAPAVVLTGGPGATNVSP